MKIQKNLRKIKLGPRYIILLAMLIFAISFFGSITPAKSAHIEEDDPKDDVWKITMLDFLYIIGEEFPDRPDSIKDVENVIEKMVVRSEQVSSPNCIDIEEIYIITDHPIYTAVIIEMEGDIKDCDYVKIIVILDDAHDNWIELEMEWDDSDGEDYEWSSEDFEGNDTTGGISGEQIGIAFPKSECNYDEGDDYIVFAFTFEGREGDPLNSIIYYDFAPNSIVSENVQGLYQGTDPITAYIAQLAQFLFGWFMIGYLPFLFLIALLLAGFRIMTDRINKIIHTVGLILLVLILYPIIFYSISINLVGVMGLPDAFALLALFTLLCFGIFILISVINNFGIIRRQNKTGFLAGCILMIITEIIYVVIYMTSEHILTLFILTGATIGLYSALILSKRNGRNKFK